MRLLLIEDDIELCQHLIRRFTEHGYVVDHADNGIDGEYLGSNEPYDAILLDLGLPQRPGLEVLKNWRKEKLSTPVLILTARDAWHERVDGFKAGADDYLGKPFHVEELIARVQALIRRASGLCNTEIEVAGLSLDEERQSVVTHEGKRVSLTGTEFRLLRFFMLHADKVLSKHQLTDHLYHSDFDRDSNLIEVYVRRLRAKIGSRHITTMRGQGYRFPGDP